MATVTLVRGKIKYPVDRIRTTKYGDRIKAVATTDSGEDFELWDYPDGPVHHLKKDETVSATWDGKKYTLIATHPPASTPPAPPAHQTPGAIAASTPVPHPQAAKSADVQEWVGIFQELRGALPDASENAWRAAASTLMMIRCKAREADF